ncbi:MAG: SUMF1/EgtB/PvdO family nonheme iron enzyme [Armatimonadetes bacterium]|nr:SUMF1/EgtB/PvdO family nonheme iron enzyme [Armatimonadota bacterium]
MRRLLPLLLLAGLANAAETYLVAAGVDQYDRPDISALKYAVADVRAVADAFRAGGVPDRNIQVFTSDQADRFALPTKSNLLAALQDVRERAVGDDTLVFMFSGHGMQKGDEPYLLTVDSNRELLEDTALPMRLVNEALRGFQAKHVLFVIDACRNDPNPGRANADARLDDSFAKGVRPRFTGTAGKPVPAAALLLACDVGQRAYEWPAEGHGAFTTYLLRGLAGEAKAEDGTVPVSRLAGYVVREVSAWAERARKAQTPRYEPPGDVDFVLLRAPDRPAPTPPAASAGVPAGWPDYLAKWREQMPKGLQYRVRARDGMPQVLIPAGEFLMGSPEGQGQDDERPQRRVYVSAFWMDQHEVTAGQYRRFCQAAGKPIPGGNPDDTHPVVNVSWDDADAYAEWVGGSLPLEAQWEKAARGGLAGMAYPWGNDWDAAQANSGAGGATPVGSYAPNGYGLFDMAGNAWEWCLDWYDEGWYGKMPDRDPCNRTEATTRVARGGSWDNEAALLGAGARGSNAPDYRGDYGGFRCAEAP